MVTERLATLRSCLKKKNIAAVAINAGPTLTYLTGLHFHLMERPVVLVVPASGRPIIILPELEQGKLEGVSFQLEIFTYGEDPATWGTIFIDALKDLVPENDKIGVEPRHLRLLEYNLLLPACRQAEIVDGSEIFAQLRSIKDEAEIACMRRAVVIAEESLEATLATLKIGVSEEEIASELFLQLLRHGSETALPFFPIVASGPNGANPHSQPSVRKLAEGDLLIIDWGARYNGYASDLTRTFAVGQIGEEEAAVYQAVQLANDAGRGAGRPGVACREVDRAARECIDSAGYGQFFTHRTGHGIGMECHEDPYMHGENRQLLEKGMTYTVEPGIYLPGRNGVRIEDDVLVTENGSESLSTMSRELRSIG
ncbi:MAG: M24 family metallopeptidase [Desulforhopalus sp.]